MENETFIVVGLGNPGREYAATRHNAGFEATEILSKRWNLPLTKKRMNGLVAETVFQGKRVVLCQPQTYMNLSGVCVSELVNWYKCPPENLLVIYDDIDLPLGRLRVRKGGSAGTHNGMRSILQHLSGQNFPRIRIGVGARPEGWDLADWVLSRYQLPEEKEAMQDAYVRAADCVEEWLKTGIEKAMQAYNAGK